jgi:hypothetical protein
MSDFSVRSDSVDVEQIMRQIRSRIREKRGVDYTEEEIRELANVKLEKFIDPKGVRSGLLDEYRRVSAPEAPAPNYAFGEDTLYETHRGPIRWIRSLLRPLLKMLFNPNPLIQALHIQADLNQRNAERWAKREHLDALHYEVIHNLVVEVTRNTLEVKSLKMRLESMASRLDFDERRARALEGVVQYRAGAVPPLQPPTGQGDRGRHDQRRDHRDHRDPRDQRPQGPRPQPQPPQQAQPSQPQTQGQNAQGAPGDQPAGNAFDNDGNERRSRRRRRRGRRRGGEGRPTSDNRYPMADAPGAVEGGSDGGAPESAGSAETAAAGAASSEHRTSDLGSRSSDSEGASGASPEPRSGDGPPPDRAES